MIERVSTSIRNRLGPRSEKRIKFRSTVDLEREMRFLRSRILDFSWHSCRHARISHPGFFRNTPFGQLHRLHQLHRASGTAGSA